MTRTRHRLLPLLAGLAAALLVLLAYAAVLRLALTSSYRGANDFSIPWRATQALLWEGRNPYGPEVTAEIQQTLFDRTRGPEEHQFDFAYPLTLAPLLAPYTLFDYEWAQPLWQATLHLLLVGALLLWVRSWRDDFPSPVAFAALALWTLSVYPAARAFLLGQVAVLVFAALALASWALVRRHDVLAGTALAIATVKPQLAFLIVPLLLAVAWRADRRRVVWAFAATLSILVLVSLALHPASLALTIYAVRPPARVSVR
ncbi:MAG TPA: glycosyltransferase family 87 protein [Ardenticatenaceae bacterium]|nr:glycosyltransferase family 87 protein [Ardenticatenaceae bacterium]